MKFGTVKLLVSFLIASSLIAQDPAPPNSQDVSSQNTSSVDSAESVDKKTNKKTKNAEDIVRGNYLDVYYAGKKANLLANENLEHISRLNVMIKNYGNDEDKSALKSVFEGYRKGMKMLYSKKILEANKVLVKNSKDIDKIFTKMAEAFRLKNLGLLSQITDKLIDLKLSTPDSSNSGKNKITQRIKVHLGVAYHQHSMGHKLEKTRPYDAISHYRVARYHAIHMLANMETTDDSRKKVLSDYKVDLEDSENRVALGKKS